MKRYYFYKRRTDIRDDLKGDLIVFSLSALYGEKAYSQRKGKETMRFKFFDVLDLNISTKTEGIYKVDVDTGTDGCSGHWANSFQELRDDFSKDGYSLIPERDYLRLRKFALRLIFKHIKFFKQNGSDATRKYLCQNDHSAGFYDVKLVSTSEKYNIRNYDDKQIEYGEKIGLPMNDLRIDEDFRIFISKDKNYKSNKFQIESSHYNAYYENYEKFLEGNLLGKGKRTVEIKDFQFERVKRKIIELIFDRSDLDISSILQKQQHTITILDI